MNHPNPKHESNIFEDKLHMALNAGVPESKAESVASVLVALELHRPKSGDIVSFESGEITISNTLEIPVTLLELAKPYEKYSHTDRFVVAAGFIFQYQHTYIVDTEIILQFYQEANWKAPSNPADAIAKASKKLYFQKLNSADKSDNGLTKWQLTNTGNARFKELQNEVKNEK